VSATIDAQKDLGFEETVELYRQMSAQKEDYLARLRAYEPQSDESRKLIEQWEEICLPKEVVFYSIFKYASHRPDEAFQQFMNQLWIASENIVAFLEQNEIQDLLDSPLAKQVQHEFENRLSEAIKDSDFRSKFVRFTEVLKNQDADLIYKIFDYLFPNKSIKKINPC
jgi:hypothetical protein